MSLCLLLTALLQVDPAATIAESPRIVAFPAQATMTVEELADRMAERDVVFFGEEHDNKAGHQMQADLLQALHLRRKDVVLSLEMFERDVQGVLDDYLKGRIDEEAFLKQARPWPNYEKDYRPLVEFARMNSLDVIAANVPRAAAKLVSEGMDPDGFQPFLPRGIHSPEDGYYRRFIEIMGDHAGTAGPDTMLRYYRSQCLKDDAMAESITDYLAGHPHRNPLVLHVCGKFHSDFGQGTVWRTLLRRPLLHVGVVSMEPAEKIAEFDTKPHSEQAHFLLVVPAEPARNSKPKSPAPSNPDKDSPEAEATTNVPQSE